jgi:hypothetical protein
MPETEVTELTYRRARADFTALREEVNRAITELPPEDAAALSEVKIKQLGQGVDPFTIAIVATIVGNVGSTAALAAWAKVVDVVKGKLGQDALGEPDKNDKDSKDS